MTTDAAVTDPPSPPCTRPRRPRALALALCAALPLLLAGCGDDSATPDGGTAPTTQGSDPSTTPDTPVRPPLELPDVAAVSADEARAMLHDPLGELQPGELGRDVLTYLHDLGDRAAINPIHEHLLAKSDGEYDEDFDAVGLGLEMLARYGEPDVAPKILAAARAAMDAEDVYPDTATSLAQVPGEASNALLVEIVDPALEHEEDGVAAALDVLAQRGVEGVRAHALAIAQSEDYEYLTRGAAIANLLKLGDPKGAEWVEKLAADEEADFEDVVTGLGVRGLTEAVDPIRTALDGRLGIDEADWVDEQACIALRTIYADGGGDALVPYLRTLLEHENAACEEEAQITLWMFGFDEAAPAVGETLELWVAGACAHANSDPENAVLILRELGRRGQALDPPFARATNAATTAEAKPDAHPTQKERIRRLNVAAAYAILKSQAN